MPHTSYLELAHDISGNKLLQRWSSSDCTGQQSGNINFLILGSLREIEEAAVISREVNIVFLNVFLTYRCTILFHNHVSLPAMN